MNVIFNVLLVAVICASLSDKSNAEPISFADDQVTLSDSENNLRTESAELDRSREIQDYLKERLISLMPYYDRTVNVNDVQCKWNDHKCMSSFVKGKKSDDKQRAKVKFLTR